MRSRRLPHIPEEAAEVSTEIARWALHSHQDISLLGGKQGHALSRVMERYGEVRITPWFRPCLREELIEHFCIRELEVPLGNDVDELLRESSVSTELEPRWAQVRINMKVDQSPLLQEGMKSDH